MVTPDVKRDAVAHEVMLGGYGADKVNTSIIHWTLGSQADRKSGLCSGPFHNQQTR